MEVGPIASIQKDEFKNILYCFEKCHEKGRTENY